MYSDRVERFQQMRLLGYERIRRQILNDELLCRPSTQSLNLLINDRFLQTSSISLMQIEHSKLSIIQMLYIGYFIFICLNNS